MASAVSPADAVSRPLGTNPRDQPPSQYKGGCSIFWQSGTLDFPGLHLLKSLAHEDQFWLFSDVHHDQFFYGTSNINCELKWQFFVYRVVGLAKCWFFERMVESSH